MTLTKKQLLNGLTTQVIGSKLFAFETIDSTNICAKLLADVDMKEGTIVLAEHQTQGKGRQGRTWLSEPGKNLLFSVIIRPPLHQNVIGLLPFFAAVAVARGIEQHTHLAVECKWPNDILINNKKCCGILLESSFSTEILRYAVIGIGINVNQERFDSSLVATATSLKQEAHRSIDRVGLFQHIVKELDMLYPAICEGNFSYVLDEWKKRTSMFGKKITILHHGTTHVGVAERINRGGGLVVQTASGAKTFYAGDVSVRY